MSLIYWWPLTANATDQISGAALSGSANLQSGGKIGDKYARQNSSQLTANNLSGLANLTSFSIAMWVRLSNTSNSSQWSDLFGLYFSNGSQSDYFRAEVNSTGGNNFDIYNNGVSGTSAGAASFSLTKNVWTHLIIIKNKGTITSYINGTKSNSTNWTSLNSAYATGEFYIGNGGMHCDYNDVRIYNHCLSPREIKLLAQGLVAHYKLEHDAPNLLINANKYTSSNPLVRTDSRYDGWEASDMYCQVVPGETYYLSCETDGQWHDHSNAGSGASPSNRYVTLWFYLTRTYDPNNAGYDNPICLTKAMRNNGKWTYTIPAGYNGLRIRTNLYSDGNPLTVKFWNFHLSRASHISQGYDCSGYGNHGTCSAALEPINDTPRYKNATLFNNNKYIITTRNNFEGMKNTYSLVYWAKHPTSVMTGKMVWGFYDSANAKYLDLYPVSNKFTLNNGGAGANLPFNVDCPTDGSWHHYAVVGDINKAYLYIDGIYKGQTSSLYEIPNAPLVLSGWTSKNEYRWNDGQISDFRLYATALSAAAVKEIYQSSIAFLDNGTLQSSQIVENNTNLKYNQNGIVQAKAIGELGHSGLMKHIVLNDGSTWARIHWLDVSSKNEYFANAAEANYCINKDNRFSLMQYMPHFKSNNNQYELLLTYPNLTAELPSGYTALQYIQTTGTQHIRTGVYGYSDGTYIRGHRWEMDIEFEANGIRQLMGYGPYGYEYWGVSADNTYEGMTVTAGERNLIVHDYSAGTAGGNKLWVNNSYRDVGSNLETSYEYSLFNLYWGGNTGYFCYCKLYRCKAITYDNFIVRDFIPAKRNSDGVIGLYDLITNTFYTNSGSGSFIGGPVQSSHTPFLKFNRWIQNDWTNNVDQGESIAFRPLSTSWPAHNGPIKPANSYTQTVYDCDHKNTGNWWAPIGLLSTNTWGGGIPAASGDTQYETELWIRIDNLPKLTKLSMLDDAIQAFQIYEL